MKNLQEKLNALYKKAVISQQEDNSETSAIRINIDRLLGNRVPVKHFPKADVEKKALSLDQLVDGRWINTHFGDIFRGEFEYHLSELYGSLDLSEIYYFTSDDYRQCFQLPEISSPEDILFIDTETTGLAGGTGTIAFMIGLGWLNGDKFIVHQYFITQLSHEEGMLELLGEVVRRFRCLVSFNGKSYDIPLLTTRFVLNRLPFPFQDQAHIDLLHQTRSLWRLAMENCKLKTVETDLLNLYRKDDIPGDIIPEIYFDYLRTNDTEKIERIFYHNRFDIISMLANLILIMKSLKSRLPEVNPLVDFAKGKLFNRKNDIDRSIAHYRNVLESSISLTRRQKTMLELAQIYKKTNQYEKALPLWEESTDQQYPFSFEPYIELAKYYEHHQKDLEKALEIIESAMVLSPSRRENERLMLGKRIARLRKKLGKQNTTNYGE